MINAMNGNASIEDGYGYIPVTHTVTLGEIANLVLNAILEPQKFPCMKEYYEYWEI